MKVRLHHTLFPGSSRLAVASLLLSAQLVPLSAEPVAVVSDREPSFYTSAERRADSASAVQYQDNKRTWKPLDGPKRILVNSAQIHGARYVYMDLPPAEPAAAADAAPQVNAAQQPNPNAALSIPSLDEYNKSLNQLLVNNIDQIDHTVAESGNANLYYNEYTPFLWGLAGAAGAGVSDNNNFMFDRADDLLFYSGNPAEPRIEGGGNYRGWSGVQPGSWEFDEAMLGTAAAMAKILSFEILDPSQNTKLRTDRLVEFFQYDILERYYDNIFGKKVPWTVDGVWTVDASYFGTICAALYQATLGISRYSGLNAEALDLATRIGNVFVAKLKDNGKGGLTWDSDGRIQKNATTTVRNVSIAGNQEGVPDTFQAGQAFRMLQTMKEAGVNLTKNGQNEDLTADLTQLSATLTEVIWNKSTTSPLFSNYINGSNAAFGSNTQAGSNGRVSQGWGGAAQYSVQARAALLSLLNPVLPGNPLPGSQSPTAFNDYYSSQINLIGDLMVAVKNPPPGSAPVVTVTSVVNAASFQNSLAAGALATIFGANLKGKTVSITFDGAVTVPADRFYYDGDTQINFQIPTALAGKSSTQMVVTIDGVSSAPKTLSLAAVAPAVFVPGILNADYKLNNYDAGSVTPNPAPAGSFVQAYMTGLLPPGLQPNQTGTSSVTAQIGGRTVPVLFAGAPDYPANTVDWYQQANIAIPSDTPAGKTTLVICSKPANGSQVCGPPVDLYVGPPQP